MLICVLEVITYSTHLNNFQHGFFLCTILNNDTKRRKVKNNSVRTWIYSLFDGFSTSRCVLRYYQLALFQQQTQKTVSDRRCHSQRSRSEKKIRKVRRKNNPLRRLLYCFGRSQAARKSNAHDGSCVTAVRNTVNLPGKFGNGGPQAPDSSSPSPYHTEPEDDMSLADDRPFPQNEICCSI